MEDIGKKLVEKYCKHQGYGMYSVEERKLIKAINNAIKKAWKEGAIEAQNNAEEEILKNSVKGGAWVTLKRG